jgi:hypothetical protein
MSLVAESILDANDGTTGLSSVNSASAFDSFYDGTNLWIALVSKIGSAGKLYKLNPVTFALNDSDNIFPGEALVNAQVTASSTNVFVGATAFTGPTLKLGVYDYNGLKLDEFDINDTGNVDMATSTTDVFNTSDIASYQILAYGAEARIVASSKATSTSNYKVYMARLRTVSSIWTLSCGDCNPISELDLDASRYVKVSAAPIRIDNGVDPHRLASDGEVGSPGNQGIKDVAFIAFGKLDDNTTPTACDPVIGVDNVEGEAINSTTIFSGSSPNEDAGLDRSPFVKK